MAATKMDPRARALEAFRQVRGEVAETSERTAARDRLRAQNVLRRLYDDADLELPGMEYDAGLRAFRVTIAGAELAIYLPPPVAEYDDAKDAQVYCDAIDRVSIPPNLRPLRSLADLGHLYAISSLGIAPPPRQHGSHEPGTVCIVCTRDAIDAR